jgi:very-short-patch-repair endonuclease
VLHHGPDAFISHQAALALWGVPGFYDTPVHVMARRVRNRQRTSLGIVHSTTDLRDTQLADVQGVPTVTPIRAIFDIAGNVHPSRVENALDNAWSRRLLNYAVLHLTLAELARRGRPGIALLRKLAAERPADFRPPDSNNERRFADILERAGERPMRRQVHLGDEADWIGRIDFVDDELPFSVEVQSEMFHGSVSARRRDKARIAALEEGGHMVLELWETELWRDPDEVVRKVREKRKEVAAGLHG